VAKIETQISRSTAFADDEPVEEQFLRPAAVSTGRVRPAKDSSSPVRRRKLLDSAGGSNADTDDDGFLRARRRVPVRRGFVPASTVGRIAAASLAFIALVVLVLLGLAIRNFFRDDPRFRIASSSSIQIEGNSQVTRSELLAVFRPDIGHNIFMIPLRERRAAAEQIPWVEHATVMRLMPDQLRVHVVERTPVAFVRQGNVIGLVDANGVLLHLAPGALTAKHYSFPVITGLSAKDPLTLRAARMHLYQQFVSDLDSGGAKISSQLSEVDISDPEDIWALLPAQGSDIQVHFGDSDFLARYRSYQQHLPEWRQQYPHLASVDMRYDNQAVLEMTKQEMNKQEMNRQASAPVQGGEGAGAVHAAAHHPVPLKHPVPKASAKSPKAAKAKG
jgi:cell division protein FtsQ